METADACFTPFADGLLDPDRPAPPGLTTWNGSDPAVRFDVYRNNVVVSLVAALAESFPVTQALVGEDFFRWMAHQFIVREPPQSPILSEHGERFPELVAAFEPAAALPYLADIARLEHLRLAAYHARDAEPLSTALVAAELQHPERLPGASLELHPSLGLLGSSYAVVSLWSAHQDGTPLAALDVDRPELALVLRRNDTVLVVGISKATASFVTLLGQGRSLGEAAAAVLETDPGFDLMHTLALLIRHGAIVAWHSSGDLAS